MAPPVPTQRNETRAAPPRPPEPTAAMRLAQQEQDAYLRAQESLERRSVLRGIVAVMLLAIIFASLRAGMDRVFYTGWWRQW